MFGRVGWWWWLEGGGGGFISREADRCDRDRPETQGGGGAAASGDTADSTPGAAGAHALPLRCDVGTNKSIPHLFLSLAVLDLVQVGQRWSFTFMPRPWNKELSSNIFLTNTNTIMVIDNSLS